MKNFNGLGAWQPMEGNPLADLDSGEEELCSELHPVVHGTMDRTMLQELRAVEARGEKETFLHHYALEKYKTLSALLDLNKRVICNLSSSTVYCSIFQFWIKK